MSEEHEDIVDEVDVEEAVKANRPVPRARRYRIRIDREHRVVEQPVVTGEFILSLVGKTPAEYLLSQRLRGGHVEEVAPDREVDLRGAGVERFMTLTCDGLQWLLIHKFPIPSGYNVECAMAALQIPPSYPDAQIDMVYFHPQLARVDGRAIPNLTDQPLDGKTFQRWSRHRQGETPWRVGVDDVGTHLLLVEEWLRRELRKS